MRSRLWIWLVPAVVYAAFWFWYTPLGGPLRADEIDALVAALEARGGDPARIERLRRFMREDDGRQLIMVNLLDMNEDPPELPVTGPAADAEALMGHYMAHMFPELLRRACHPIFDGGAVFTAMDVAGIEGAETWDRAALMRYRSRRDLLEIATHPAFGDRHEYKLAALTKTIAFPVQPRLYVSDPRLLLAVLLIAAAAVLHLVLLKRG